MNTTEMRQRSAASEAHAASELGVTVDQFREMREFLKGDKEGMLAHARAMGWTSK